MTPGRPRFNGRLQPLPPARPLPGNGVIRPPPSWRTRPESLRQVGNVYLNESNQQLGV